MFDIAPSTAHGTSALMRGVLERLDPGGKFLYLPLMQANQVASYEIGADGSLTLLDTENIAGGPFDLVTTP